MNKKELIQIIRGICKDNNYTFEEKYSGQLMHNKSCIGMRHHIGIDFEANLLNYCHKNNIDVTDETYLLVRDMNRDRVSLEHITYFPFLSIEDETK